MSTLAALAAAVVVSRHRKALATEAAFGPGGRWCDVAELLFGGGEDDGDDPAERLARPLSRRWRLFREEPRALAERADRTGRTRVAEKRLLARTGLLLAAGDIERPQRIRLGRQWVAEPDGSPAVVPPVRLKLDPLLRWYRAAAISAAEAALLDEAWPAPDSPPPDLVPLEDAMLLPDAVRNPLEELIFREDARRLEERLASAELAPALGDLLGVYLKAGSWAAAGEALGLTPATLRQRKRRLLHTLRDVTDSGGSRT